MACGTDHEPWERPLQRSLTLSPPPPSVHLTLQSTRCELTASVPLHARYPHPRSSAPQQGSWLAAALSAAAVAELPPPVVLALCGGGWQAADVPAAPPAVRWEMPAGNLQHGPLIAAGTAGAVGCGVAAVLWALLRPLPNQAAQRRKAD